METDGLSDPLDRAHGLSVPARAEFAEGLLARVVATAEARDAGGARLASAVANRRRVWMRRVVAAYLGVAAGLIIFALHARSGAAAGDDSRPEAAVSAYVHPGR